MRLRAAITCALTAALLGAVGTGTAGAAQLIYGTTEGDRLVTFRSSSPGNIERSVPITGVAEAEDIVGLDVRPATGELYGLGTSNVIYRIDPSSGAATAVGGAFVPSLSGENFGFDFNPTVDRIRLVSDAEQNLRLNPNNGQTVGEDGALTYPAGDVSAGANPNVGSAAYTNSVAGATSTALYVIDTQTNALATLPNPNDGVLNTVGALGFDVEGRTNFDVGADGIGYASLIREEREVIELYRVDLGTGRASPTAAKRRIDTVESDRTSTDPLIALATAGTAADDRARPRVRLVLGSRRESTLLRNGLRFVVTCNEACTIDARVTAGGRRVGRRARSVRGRSGRTGINVNLNSLGRALIRRAGTTRFALSVRVTDAAGNRTTRSRSIRTTR